MRSTDVKIEVPVVPPTFYCVGLNYRRPHPRGSRQATLEGRSFPSGRTSAIAPYNALIAHEALSSSRRRLRQGAVRRRAGRRLRQAGQHLSQPSALSCVFGYTIGNDVSERAWQKADRTLWRAKNADTFKPMGPWIDTDVDLDAMETIIRLNGKETLRFLHQRHDLRRRTPYISDDHAAISRSIPATRSGWAPTASRPT